MRARLYLPVEGPIVSPILYIHGGGWTFGSIDTHDGTMRNLAEAAQRPVLGIDYRLAPEHPFPAPLDDVLTAIAFVETGGLGTPISAHDMAIAGDSAGANLALAALLARRDRRLPQLASAALFYGCYAPDFTTREPCGIRGRRLSAHQREHALVLDQFPRPRRRRHHLSRCAGEVRFERIAAALPVGGRPRSAPRRYASACRKSLPPPAFPSAAITFPAWSTAVCA